MALDFIHNFQTHLYRTLCEDEQIRLSVDNIYLSVTQDAKYPFLLINIIKIKDLSQFTSKIYEVEFEICAFARDKSQKILAPLADKIVTKLTAENCKIIGYAVAGIKTGAINFQRGHDLLTTKLSINYVALIKKEW